MHLSFTTVCLLCGIAIAAFAPTGALAQPLAEDQILLQEEAESPGKALLISPATVRQVQQELNRLGYHAGHVDGVWGLRSEQAMMNWQQTQGLEPTGQINVRSLAALGVMD